MCVVVGQTTERGIATRWNVQGMIQTPGDPFHYMEVRHAEGPNLKLDVGELLGMMVPKTKQIKALAIVYSKDRTCIAVLRARAAWDSLLGQVGFEYICCFYAVVFIKAMLKCLLLLTSVNLC